MFIKQQTWESNRICLDKTTENVLEKTVENVLIKQFTNLTIEKTYAYDSTTGIQIHDFANNLRNFFKKYGNTSIISNLYENGQILIKTSFFEKNHVFYKHNYISNISIFV